MPSVRDPFDPLLLPTWIVPMEPTGVVLRDHALGIHDGQIALVAPHEQAMHHGAIEIRELPGMLLVPGLVNAHGHSATSLFRGLAGNLPLMTWLQDRIWPAEGQWVNEDFVRDDTELVIAEQVEGGITYFSDMYFYPRTICGMVHDSGVRAQMAVPVLDFSIPGARDSAEAICQGMALFNDLKHHPRIRIVFGPYTPYAVGGDKLEQILVLTEELDTNIQMHVHETAFEVEQAMGRNGKRPLAHLHRLGLLGPRFQAVHMTQVGDDNLAMLMETNSSAIHCPESNLGLASGFCPVEKLWQAGVNVAAGTDGTAGNNDLDLLGEIRTVVPLTEAAHSQATTLGTHRALHMATLNGTRALGLERLIGSLEAGKAADLVAFDLSGLTQQPVYDPVSQLVYTSDRDCMRYIWVGGRQLLDDDRLFRHGEQRLIAEAREWGAGIVAGNRS